jgi:hypothetical protein
MRRRLLWLPIVLLAPLLLGAADPAEDLVSCDGTTRPDTDAPIDILRASGTTAEDGLALRFTITFASPVPVPDEEGLPLRVDVLLRDPTLSDLSVDYYRALNRIVRFDDLGAKAGLVVLLLPERADSPFTNGVKFDGDTLTLTVPSRMVMHDPDLEGFDYDGLRWTVVAQDEGTCDLLGERARPTERVKVLAQGPSPSPDPAATRPDPGDPLVSGGFLVACVLAIAVGGGAGFAAARWRRAGEAPPR